MFHVLTETLEEESVKFPSVLPLFDANSLEVNSHYNDDHIYFDMNPFSCDIFVLYTLYVYFTNIEHNLLSVKMVTILNYDKSFCVRLRLIFGIISGWSMCQVSGGCVSA